MEAFICRTCGVQYAPSEQPPARCPICEDERQCVGWNGQQWTTLAALRDEGRAEPPLRGGSRAWSPSTPARPSPSGSARCWSRRRAATSCGTASPWWTTPPSPPSASWAGWRPSRSRTRTSTRATSPGARRSAIAPSTSTQPTPSGSSTRLQPSSSGTPRARRWRSCRASPSSTPAATSRGSQALHWAAATGRGALLTGDTVTVVMDRRYVSFMYSYPNLIPLGERAITRIVDSLKPFLYERMYGGWNGRVVGVGRVGRRRAVGRAVPALHP